jgi:hypothetical protein
LCDARRAVSDELRLWRAHEWLGLLPFLWAAFHLWEQWSAFAGRDAWIARMGGTSVGVIPIATELALAILPALVWLVLEVRLRLPDREPVELARAMAEDPAAARRLGLLARACSCLFFVWVLHHAWWLWGPKLTDGSEPLIAWNALREGMGAPVRAALNAIGLVAMTVHFWAAVPRVAIVSGWAQTPETRRAARLSGLIVALGLAVLYAQLAGWHAAGHGTIWPLSSGVE